MLSKESSDTVKNAPVMTRVWCSCFTQPLASTYPQNISNKARLSFKGCPFHRVVRDGWIQGGDIVSGAGEGGCSIYGGVFGDETFAVKLDEAGTLAMANDGPHTNASQFLVTLAPQPWLNHKVVGFGR